MEENRIVFSPEYLLSQVEIIREDSRTFAEKVCETIENSSDAKVDVINNMIQEHEATNQKLIDTYMHLVEMMFDIQVKVKSKKMELREKELASKASTPDDVTESNPSDTESDLR